MQTVLAMLHQHVREYPRRLRLSPPRQSPTLRFEMPRVAITLFVRPTLKLVGLSGLPQKDRNVPWAAEPGLLASLPAGLNEREHGMTLRGTGPMRARVRAPHIRHLGILEPRR